MTNGYHIEEHIEEHEKNEKIKDVAKYLTNLYKNEVACEAYNKMLHANIVFKRFLTEWTVVKHISAMEKEKIQETVLSFRDEMKTRHTQIMSFIRSEIDNISPKLTNILLRVQTYAKKNVHLITMISEKFKRQKTSNM
jgi:hypothetical protein